MAFLGGWFAHGLGAALGRALFGRGSGEREGARGDPGVRTGTEADFLADERRFAEDERRLEAQATEEERRGDARAAHAKQGARRES